MLHLRTAWKAPFHELASSSSDFGLLRAKICFFCFTYEFSQLGTLFFLLFGWHIAHCLPGVSLVPVVADAGTKMAYGPCMHVIPPISPLSYRG